MPQGLFGVWVGRFQALRANLWANGGCGGGVCLEECGKLGGAGCVWMGASGRSGGGSHGRFGRMGRSPVEPEAKVVYAECSGGGLAGGLASRKASRADRRQRLLEQGVVRTSAAATLRELAKDPSGRRSAQARARRATRANHRTRAIGRSECCACRRDERRTCGTSKVGLRAWCGVLARGLSTGRLCRDQGRWVL